MKRPRGAAEQRRQQALKGLAEMVAEMKSPLFSQLWLARFLLDRPEQIHTPSNLPHICKILQAFVDGNPPPEPGPPEIAYLVDWWRIGHDEISLADARSAVAEALVFRRRQRIPRGPALKQVGCAGAGDDG